MPLVAEAMGTEVHIRLRRQKKDVAARGGIGQKKRGEVLEEGAPGAVNRGRMEVLGPGQQGGLLQEDRRGCAKENRIQRYSEPRRGCCRVDDWDVLRR